MRMTGRWQDYEDRYCRWYIELDTDEILWFRNPRCLATLEFTSKNSVLQKYLNKLGPDILTEDFNLDIWKQLIQKHSNKNITAFLMNQNIISGIGNYIKAEALYYCKVSPLRKTGSLCDIESDKLFEGIKIIPRVSYNNKGMSMSDYTDHKGEKGLYSGYLQIYGKHYATKLKTPDGRVTHWDPTVQI